MIKTLSRSCRFCRRIPHCHVPTVNTLATRQCVKPGKKEPQTTAWAYTRAGGGRGFGFTGAHVHNNWMNDNFRKLVLNAIIWTAKITVPADGVVSPTPSKTELNSLRKRINDPHLYSMVGIFIEEIDGDHLNFRRQQSFKCMINWAG